MQDGGPEQRGLCCGCFCSARGCQPRGCHDRAGVSRPVSQRGADPSGSGCRGRRSPRSGALGLDRVTRRGPFQPLPVCDSVILLRGGGQRAGRAAPVLPSPPPRSCAVGSGASPRPGQGPGPTGHAAQRRPRSRATGPWPKSEQLRSAVPVTGHCRGVLFRRGSPQPRPESLVPRGKRAMGTGVHEAPQPGAADAGSRGCQRRAAEQPGQGTRGSHSPLSCRSPAPRAGQAAGRVLPDRKSPSALCPPNPSSHRDAAGSKTEPVRLPSTDGGSWVLLGYVLPCKIFPRGIFFSPP